MAEKKTQPLRPGGAWVHGLWEIVDYVSSDMARKHDKMQRSINWIIIKKMYQNVVGRSIVGQLTE